MEGREKRRGVEGREKRERKRGEGSGVEWRGGRRRIGGEERGGGGEEEKGRGGEGEEERGWEGREVQEERRAEDLTHPSPQPACCTVTWTKGRGTR